MKNKRLELKIYIKSKRKPLCIIEVDDLSILEELYKGICENNLLLLGQVLISADEFKYATIEYK